MNQTETHFEVDAMKTTFWMCLISAVVGGLLAVALTQPGGVLDLSSPAFAADPAQQDASPENAVFRQPQVGGPRLDLTPEEQINVAVYEKVNRSVVNIRTVGMEMDAFGFSAIPTEGAGSGWVLDQRGHIVTNFHVIADSDAVEVTLFDGQTSAARVIGADPANDIALLSTRFPADSLFPVEIGDSADLRVGQKIYAIGNPFGLERTMTEGIVSSLNRTLRAKTREARLIKSIIQIDAALNQGNSGGPLLDIHGTLVGMNTAIASSTGDNSGIGFAVPVNTIKRVVPQLLEHGRVIRPTLGISQMFASRLGLGIHSLVEDGPAYKAGLKSSSWVETRRYAGGVMVVQRSDPRNADLILAIDGTEVDSFDTLLSEVEKRKPGETVTLTILRGGKQLNVAVVLESER